MVPGDVVAEALGRFGVDPATARPLARGGAPDGLVLSCRRDGADAFCKLMPLPDATGRELARLRDVVALTEHLRGAVGVVRYLPSLAGDLLEEVPGHVACLTARAPGRHVDEREALDPAFVRDWAGTLGRIHAATGAWTGGGALRDWRDEYELFRSGCRDDAMAAAWDELHARTAALPTDRAGFGVVHNDLHHGNLLRAPDGALTVLDLDVASWHWYATDLAILLAHPLWSLRDRPDDARRFAATAVEAYLAEFPLPPERLADVPLLARYRLTLFVLAMQAELGSRPAPGWLRDVRAAVLDPRPLPCLAVLADVGPLA
jgi:Ser/Thr protein kinase RdoA (MazF antagonist)